MKDPADDFTPIEAELVRRAREIGFKAANDVPDVECGLGYINEAYRIERLRRQESTPSPYVFESHGKLVAIRGGHK